MGISKGEEGPETPSSCLPGGCGQHSQLEKGDHAWLGEAPECQTGWTWGGSSSGGGFPGGSVVKNPPANAGDVGSILGSGRSPGGNGNPLQPWTQEPGGLQPNTTEHCGTTQVGAFLLSLVASVAGPLLSHLQGLL